MERNHLSAPLKLEAWHEGAQSSSSSNSSNIINSSNATCLSMSDVWLWIGKHRTSVLHERYGEKLGLLLSSFNTNPIKCQSFSALNATLNTLKEKHLYSPMRPQQQWQKSERRVWWISVIKTGWNKNSHLFLASWWSLVSSFPLFCAC